MSGRRCNPGTILWQGPPHRGGKSPGRGVEHHSCRTFHTFGLDCTFLLVWRAKHLRRSENCLEFSADRQASPRASGRQMGTGSKPWAGKTWCQQSGYEQRDSLAFISHLLESSAYHAAEGRNKSKVARGEEEASHTMSCRILGWVGGTSILFPWTAHVSPA